MTRDLPPNVAAIGVALARNAGGYLRNTVRVAGVTCQVCSTPWPYSDTCNQCHRHEQSGMLIADRVASMVYAPKRLSSGQPGQMYVALFGYKSVRPQVAHTELIQSLLGLAISGHMVCGHKLAQQPVFRWAAVPSTQRPPQEHPLRRLVAARFQPGFEVALTTRPGAVKERTLQPANFEIHGTILPGTHVTVLDDSWVTGGSAQSAAVALRTAGAATVSILTLARVLGPEFGPNSDFMRSGYWQRDFDYTVCPWTGSGCP